MVRADGGRAGRRRQGEWLAALLFFAAVGCAWSQAPCDGYDCGHGTCSGNKQCTCSGGWSGNRCDHATGCDNNPCGGHGACVANGGSYSCTCSGGWSGSTCAVDPCTGYACGHGTCHGNKQCTCDSGWSGNPCNHPTGCDHSPCVHGTCTATGGEHTCDCSGTGYTGPSNCATGVQCSAADLPSPLPKGISPASITNNGRYPSTATYTDTCGKKNKLVGPVSWTCGKDGHYTPTVAGGSSTTLSCQKCPDIPHCDNIDCKHCSSWSWGDCESDCDTCAAGYPGGNKHECLPQQCDPLSLDNGQVTFSVDPPTFSGSAQKPLTTATFTCDKGYQLSYDGLTKAAQKPTACQTDGSWSGMTPTPTCMRTCEPDAGGAGPCTADKDGNQRSTGCDDGGDHSKKFLCQCKLGWQGERCEHDVNECSGTAYTGACVERSDIAKPRTQELAYSLQDGLSCSQPYWVSADSGKHPSGCDRDSGGNPLTSCYNLQ
eukprot:COSAG02_NODE_8921_length_2400_cov_1.271186_3_plen_486_part_01